MSGALAEALVVAAPLRVEALALRRGDPNLRVVRTGMGPARARSAAERLRGDRARAVAIGGVCGSLDPALVPGDVFVPDALLAPDGSLVRRVEADALCGALAALGLAPQRGGLIGTDHLMMHGGERERMRELGARVVDMESPWLAEGAGARPLAVLRVVSDGPGHELWSLGLVRNGIAALRRLRAAAPALARWAQTQE
jgi:4-hydroxy-3-methylbut-2-enyl diphosphate reductase